MVNIRKAAMIGCGFVGSSSAFALMQSGIFSEMVIKCTLCQGHYDFSFSDFYFIFVCCVEASK